MATCIESPNTLVAHDHRSQTELYRLVVPALYAVIGISIGTLAGASLALSSQPMGNPLAYYHAAPASSTVSQAATVPIVSSAPLHSMVNTAPVQSVINSAPVQSMMNSAPAPVQNVLSAVFVQPADSVRTSYTIGTAAVNPFSPGVSHAHRALKARRLPASQVTPNRAPAAERRAEPRFTPEEHQSRPAAHPVKRPVRTVLASVTLDSSGPLAGQPNAEAAPLSATFYTEGDLTVAAYDAASGTIQSSDGRTFVIGSTVSLSTATPWSDYQGDVHYRCAGNGSCTLVRPGVLASNARLI